MTDQTKKNGVPELDDPNSTDGFAVCEPGCRMKTPGPDSLSEARVSADDEDDDRLTYNLIADTTDTGDVEKFDINKSTGADPDKGSSEL